MADKSYRVVKTSPFGRRGDVVSRDADNARVKRYVEVGLLEEVDADEVAAEEEQQQEQQEAVRTVTGEPVDESGQVNSPVAPQYDPSEHGVPEVQAYLESADDEERQRVLDAERAGKGRKTILGDDG